MDGEAMAATVMVLTDMVAMVVMDHGEVDMDMAMATTMTIMDGADADMEDGEVIQAMAMVVDGTVDTVMAVHIAEAGTETAMDMVVVMVDMMTITGSRDTATTEKNDDILGKYDMPLVIIKVICIQVISMLSSWTLLSN